MLRAVRHQHDTLSRDDCVDVQPHGYSTRLLPGCAASGPRSSRACQNVASGQRSAMAVAIGNAAPRRRLAGLHSDWRRRRRWATGRSGAHGESKRVQPNGARLKKCQAIIKSGRAASASHQSSLILQSAKTRADSVCCNAYGFRRVTFPQSLHIISQIAQPLHNPARELLWG